MTRKIISAVARIKHGLDMKLYLGNIEARRDWGYAKEYVEAMHLMLQQPNPDDFVIATGETHSVREFCELAFGEVDLDYHDFVEIDGELIRPADVELLLGDASKAEVELGWKPQTKFEDLIRIMVSADMDAIAPVAALPPLQQRSGNSQPVSS